MFNINVDNMAIFKGSQKWLPYLRKNLTNVHDYDESPVCVYASE